MAKSVWKYQFAIADRVSITMPLGAQELSVQMQSETACLWALVDPAMPPTSYAYCVFGTGHPVPDQFDVSRFVGTFQAHGGALVFHLFRDVNEGS